MDDALLLTVNAMISGIMENSMSSDVLDHISSISTFSSLTNIDRFDIKLD